MSRISVRMITLDRGQPSFLLPSLPPSLRPPLRHPLPSSLPPPPPPPLRRFTRGQQSVSTFVKTQRVAMSAARVTGAAARRRERRLRSMLRHERQTVAIELAAHLHHSRDGPGKLRRPTGTDDSELRDAAQRPHGAGAAGTGSHGRLRGCPGSAPRGVVDGWG